MTVDLRRVAKASGVSVSTASRALAGSSRISSDTRHRVRRAADELGYRPNATARALRTARSQMIGLVVTNLYNASFRLIAEVVQQCLEEQGYHLVLSITGGDAEHERSSLRTLIDHNATGVIMVGSDSAAAHELKRSGLPVVHLARRPDEPAGDCVLGDDLTGAQDATRYLLELGHERIAIIAGPRSVTSGRERLLGYRQEMRRAGRPMPTHLRVAGPFLPATGADGVRRLLSLPASQRPTALIVANHEASLGALPTLLELGVDVPAELSLICFEDSELTRWWHPAITVVDINAAEMGRTAARLLLSRIEGAAGNQSSPREVRVGGTFVVRASTAPA